MDNASYAIIQGKYVLWTIVYLEIIVLATSSDR